ncbi:hypothetical protein [Rubellimicrobium aerolatum]|uniref:Uncharacterized protein n=1 Tax=Rubellimicrobium aerolatum TaxID=490979 RepID=A0ABW0SAW3_9RHOB|nr:hypothetical protein [Rubellimicrobium aerolatum]MBP1806109.1 hypothetical protein [Rubellimicrobium aerolatum]
MLHYHLTWTDPRPDEPDWMACEVSEEGHVTRLVEHFALGWTDWREATREERDSLWADPFAPPGPDDGVALREIAPEDFEALWNQSEAGSDE